MFDILDPAISDSLYHFGIIFIFFLLSIFEQKKHNDNFHYFNDIDRNL